MYKLPRKLTEILVLAQSLEHSTCALQAGRERGGRKTAAWTLNRKILVPVPVQRHKRRRFDPWVRKIPWSRKWQPVPVYACLEILWTEEPGGLQSMGWHRVRQD